ncbi:MAG: hypothetical protein B1H13_07090 [Desulfobacteraceae bacterium 4484_190.3]|nr:MAG: hypothetical protein B1H13_07090 [Desulfobacteraceae bacterium 4484_190.3]
MFTLESSAFKNGDTLPKKYTIDGEKTSPPLKWEDVPKGTKSLALTVTDSDTPMGGIFVLWGNGSATCFGLWTGMAAGQVTSLCLYSLRAPCRKPGHNSGG